MTLAIDYCTTGVDRIKEDMTNSNISEIITIPIDTLGDKTQSPIRSGREVEGSGSDFKEFWRLAQKMPKPGTSGPIGNEMVTGSGKDFYLDQLRKGLSAKGKTLNDVTIAREDFPLLKEFLVRLGFSKENADQIIKDLAEKHPGGVIPLSLFIKHIAERDTPETVSLNRPHMKPSEIPHLESALRAMGLTPKEVEHVFNGTRDEVGGLDLTKLTANLKRFLQETREGPEIESRRGAFGRFSENLEKFGLSNPIKEKTEQISSKGVISSWERVTGTTDKGEPSSGEMKGLIDRILQKATVTKETPGSLPLLTLLDKLKGEHQAVREKIIGREEVFNGVDPSEKKDLFKKDVLSKKTGPFKTRDTLQQKDPIVSPTGKATKQVVHGHKESGSPISGKGAEFQTEPTHSHGSDTGRNPENVSVQSDKTAISMPSHTNASSFADAVQAVKTNQTPVKDVLPAQLVERVGKQISRSLQKGDRIIRIQLKPPELGTVKVEMDLKENVLKLGMIIENKSVKELLLANAHELREALVDHGFKLEKIDVQIGGHSNPTFGDLKEGLNGGQRGNQGWKTYLPPTEGHWADTLTDQQVPFYREQMLDLVA